MDGDKYSTQEHRWAEEIHFRELAHFFERLHIDLVNNVCTPEDILDRMTLLDSPYSEG